MRHLRNWQLFDAVLLYRSGQERAYTRQHVRNGSHQRNGWRLYIQCEQQQEEEPAEDHSSERQVMQHPEASKVLLEKLDKR